MSGIICPYSINIYHHVIMSFNLTMNLGDVNGGTAMIEPSRGSKYILCCVMEVVQLSKAITVVLVDRLY